MFLVLMLMFQVFHLFLSLIRIIFLIEGQVFAGCFSANDKSFSRLFSEAPFLPESAFKLLDDICCSDNNYGKDVRDGDRVHQGLGSLWSLILGRPNTRQAFLDIALRVSVFTYSIFEETLNTV